MKYLKLILPVALGYLALVPNLEPANVIAAFVVGLIVTALTRPVLRESEPGHLFVRAPIGLARYMVWLVWDIIRNGIAVARIVLAPTLPIRPGIIAIKSGMRTEAGTALSAHAITVTPGEMVVAVDEDGTMYTHCLDAVNSGGGAVAAQTHRRALLAEIAE